VHPVDRKKRQKFCKKTQNFRPFLRQLMQALDRRRPMYEKITLIVIGIAIARIFDALLKRRNINKLEEALIEELEDIQNRLFNIRRSYERSIQIYALNGIEMNAQLPIPNKIYEKYFVDVALKLGSSQRMSFSLIHGYVDVVNSGIRRVEEKCISVTREKRESDLLEWGDLIKVQYQNVAIAYWYVSFHLKNKEMPYLGNDGSEAHTAMLKEIKDRREYVDKLIENARENLSKDQI
jgi:sRNA-binding regulator protein Hfq